MSTKFKGDIVHTEKYQDKQTGEEKKKYTRVGGLFEREDGSLCINFLGSWLNVYPPKMKEDGYQAAKEAARGPQDNEEDSIPF